MGRPHLVAPDPVTAQRPARPTFGQEVPAHLDEETVEAVKRGERWAWEAAYRAYSKGLNGFLVLRLGNADEAAEALSETFLRALDRAHSLRGGADSFRAWLFRIARNVAFDRLRAKQRRPITDHEVDPIDLLLAEPDAELIASEDAEAVRRAMGQLDADDREVLWLRICARLSSADVGEIIGKRPGAVRMQQQRALTALARHLGLG